MEKNGDTTRPRLWQYKAKCLDNIWCGDTQFWKSSRGMLMLIKSASVLMCYSRIKRWNGFLHCSLGTGHPVLASVHFIVRVVRVTYCYSHSPWLSCPLFLCVSNILDIFQHCPELFILYPHKTNADWNQLLHLWPVFRCQKYRGVNSKIFSQK